MTIRTFEPTDIESLHRLYNEIVTRIPHHPPVDYYPNMPRGNYLPEGEIALVAIEGGRPVAFACGSFLPAAGEFLPERAGLLRFLFAARHTRSPRSTNFPAGTREDMISALNALLDTSPLGQERQRAGTPVLRGNGQGRPFYEE